MTRMLLVRHAESEWNAQGRWQGRADPPLSDLGLQQAAEAAANAGMFDAIFSSTLDRAVTTAGFISRATGVGPVITDEGLIERDAGEWSGLTRSQIERDWPGYLEHRKRPPSYELDEPFRERVLPALDRIAVMMGDAEVLVLCHGGVIYVIEELLGAPFVRVPNLGGRWIDGADGSYQLGERVALLDNSTAQAPDIL